MDPGFIEPFDDIYHFDQDCEPNSCPPYSDSDHHYPQTMNQFQFIDPSLGLYITHNVPAEEGSSFVFSSLSGQNEGSSSSACWSQDDGSPSDEGEVSEHVLGYIRHMLLEETTEDEPNDPLALETTEKSLYALLVEQYPPPLPEEASYVDVTKSPGVVILSDGSVDCDGTGSSTTTSTDPLNNFPFLLQNSDLSDHAGDAGLLSSSINEFLVQNIFTDNESVLQFRRGLAEASKFLPGGDKLVTDLEKNILANKNNVNGSRARKNHEREDIDLEERRANKQSAVYEEEIEMSEMLDRVLHITAGSNPPYIDHKSLQKNRGVRARAKKKGKKKEAIDLRALLLLCTQAISANNLTIADELFKQIRQHSTPCGDASQRLAHYFADGLEARLERTPAGIKNFLSLSLSKKSATDVLEDYNASFSTCPFIKLAIFLANKMILSAAEKAKTLHIIDFGIMYGFQWPMLIQYLSSKPGGPPKLRITGIELPGHGFRPTGRNEETGRRLAKYCERFNVPFEYNAIASQDWETIQISDLKIDSNEFVAVNCLSRFTNLLDETVDARSPRNAVLDLIKKMNPGIFVHAISNGLYNTPFFVSRFREALFHFSAWFDMIEAIAPPGNIEERLMYECELLGLMIKNVVACEGAERGDRPESYKQWQVRTLNAGFRQLPLDQELMKKLKAKLKEWYHKDFVIDQDMNWMLQGWKGRILCASSCWVPS